MVTIGLTEDADQKINELKEKFGFKSSKDMALFAFSYAVRHNLPQIPIVGTQTKWGTSTFDNADFETIIKICYPQNEEDPIGIFKDLIHAGIYQIYKEKREKPNLTISDLMK